MTLFRLAMPVSACYIRHEKGASLRQRSAMSNKLPTASMNPLNPIVAPAAHAPVSLDQNPAAIYLASLGNESRRTMRTALNTIAELLGVAEVLDADGRDARFLAVPWGSLRSEHTIALHAQLQAR